MVELNIDEIKKIQLDILKNIDKYCRNNDLKYFLAYGSLIGAIRHKGYIPWDDDIDIVMLRSDFEKFIKGFNKYNDKYMVKYCENDERFPYFFAKVEDKTTKVVENVYYKYELGINVDIFILDNVGDDVNNAYVLTEKMMPYKKLLKCKNIFPNSVKKRSFPKNIIVSYMKRKANRYSIAEITKPVVSIGKTYENTESKYVAVICCVSDGYKYVFEKTKFEKTIDLPFEDMMAMVPECYDEILTTWFGDYMKLPPEEQQVTHHDYKAYMK